MNDEFQVYVELSLVIESAKTADTDNNGAMCGQQNIYCYPVARNRKTFRPRTLNILELCTANRLSVVILSPLSEKCYNGGH